MKTRHIIVIGSLVLLLASRGEVRADDRITAFKNARGKIVFTNLAGYNARVAEPAPTIPTAPTPTTATPPLAVSPAGAMDRLIDGIAGKYRIDPSLVRAVIGVESNNDRRAVSHKGARGLMQLMPETGKRFGVRDFFDPAQNIEGGVRYLRFLLEKFEGNLDLSLAAYNSGENRVARLGRIPRIPETQNYVRKVRAAYERIRGQARPVVGQSRAAQTLATNPTPQPAGVTPTTGSEASGPAPTVIYRRVDERGVAHFSNVGPQR
jgi:hypothetical protein